MELEAIQVPQVLRVILGEMAAMDCQVYLAPQEQMVQTVQQDLKVLLVLKDLREIQEIPVPQVLRDLKVTLAPQEQMVQTVQQDLKVLLVPKDLREILVQRERLELLAALRT